MFIKPENAKKLMLDLAMMQSSKLNLKYLSVTTYHGNTYSFGSDGFVAVGVKQDFGFEGPSLLADMVLHQQVHGAGYIDLDMPTTTQLRRFFRDQIKLGEVGVFFAGQAVDPHLALSVLKYTKRDYPIRVRANPLSGSAVVLSVNDIWYAVIMPLHPKRIGPLLREQCSLFWKHGLVQSISPDFSQIQSSD